MRVHYFQHVDHEGLAALGDYFTLKGAALSSTKMYEGEPLPELEAFDVLVVMGGPMGVYEREKYPWLDEEIAFIKSAIDAGKKVLGICLGSQLIAAALGSDVYKMEQEEIGWFPVELNQEITEIQLGYKLPNPLEALHWHGDTFDLPDGAALIGSSEGAVNQGFLYREHVLALQFHLEMMPESAGALADKFPEDFEEGGAWVQNREELFADEMRFHKANQVLAFIMDRFLGV